MRMFSARNMDVISTGPVVNLVMKNLVLEAKSEFHGFVGKDCQLFWSTGVLKWLKIPNSKSQITNKSQ